MKVSCKALLILSCISFSLHAMEQQSTTLTTTSNSQIKINIDYSSLLENLYEKAHKSLENYEATSIRSLKDIFEISALMKILKEKKVEAQEIGAFAHKQPFTPPVFWDGTTPYHNPLYTSLFLERIAQHHAHLEKNKFISPTTEQFCQYKRNIKNEDAIEIAATIGVFIDLKKEDPTNTVIVKISDEVVDGAKELDQLIQNIMEIKKIPPHKIQTITDILYKPKL